MGRWLAAVLLVVGVAACGSDDEDPVPLGSGATGADEAVAATVGAVLSLTGAAAPYAESQRRGLELAVADTRAAGIADIDLVVVDDESDPDAGVATFERLIDEGVTVIIGPTLSNTATATDPVAQAAGVPVLAISNTVGDITDIGDHIFRASLTETQVIPSVVARAVEEYDVQTVAVLHGEGDAFTAASYEVFVAALADEEIDVVATESFRLGDGEFSAQLDRLVPLDPDAIVVSALAAEGAAILVEAREAGYAGPILGGNGFNSPTVIETAGEAAEGLVVGAAWSRHSSDPTSQAFVAAYEQAHGGPPDQFAAQAYAGLQIVGAALQAAGTADRSAVRDALASIDDLPTPLGPFSFTPDRNADAPAAVTIVRDGDLQLLD